MDGLLGRIDARAFALDRDVGLHRRQAGHDQGKATRRRERLRVLVGEAGCLEPGADLLLKLLRPARLHARRDFLGEHLQQKVRHGLCSQACGS